MLQNELETAITIARIAGQRVLEHYANDVETEQKLGVDDHFEPVTVADRDANRIIVGALRTEFPSDAILSEEEPDNLGERLAARRVWIIDPIDGTAGFVKKDGDFGIQIGLAEAGRPILGVVFLPFHDLMSFAVIGGGSFLQTGDGVPIRMCTSDHTDIADMTLAVSRNHRSPKMARIIDHLGLKRVVNRGSVGLKVGLIADQTCDIYIHPSPRTKIWDTCAPQIILEEAGGTFTDLFGGEMRYDRAELQNLNGILATNGCVHNMTVESLGPLLGELGRLRLV